MTYAHKSPSRAETVSLSPFTFLMRNSGEVHGKRSVGRARRQEIDEDVQEVPSSIGPRNCNQD